MNGKRSLFICALVLSLSVSAGAAVAQQNIDKLKQFKVSGTDLNIPTVPQTGKSVDAIQENLKKIKLPPGFKIELFAMVPDARHMAVGPSTAMLFVGTRKTSVWAVTDRSGGSGAAVEVKPFAPSLKFKNPNALCWTKDGMLILAEHNRVLLFPAAEFFYESPDVAVAEVVPQGKLIPEDEESFNHGARVCRVGADGKLYIALGQPFNVPPRDKLKLYDDIGMMGIIRMNLDGTGREVYARGVRNSVGMDFNPKDGTLWFTDNQTDGMGDDTPPGELNRATKAGQNFGYPYVCGHVRIKENGYDKDPLPKDVVYPQVEMAPHAADLGMAFYTGKQFPAKYRGGIFDAQHGSWNRTKPVGARIMFTPLKADGTADKTEVFADGWLDSETGAYRGRPVDVAVWKDGSLLVSDDFAGAIYRISYSGDEK